MNRMRGVAIASCTCCAWYPTTTKTRSAGANSRAVSTTCSTNALPPARCSTLAFRDFMRVPRPAARITTVTGVSMIPLCLPISAPPAFLGEFDYHSRRPRGVMPHFTGGLSQIPSHYFQPQFKKRIDIVLYGQRIFPCVSPLQCLRNRPNVYHGVIQKFAAGMMVNRADMVACPEIRGLSRLPHQVDKVGLYGWRPADGCRHAIHQQIGNYARKQGTGTKGDHIGFGNGGQRSRQRAGAAR